MFTNGLDVSTKQLSHLVTIQPHGLIFKTHVQPDGFVRLVHDNLVLVSAHSVFLSMRILYQTSRLCAHYKCRLQRGGFAPRIELAFGDSASLRGIRGKAGASEMRPYQGGAYPPAEGSPKGRLRGVRICTPH